MKQYRAGRIWASLKRKPGQTCKELAATLQSPIGPISTRLSAMRKEGHVRRDPHGRHTKWYAIGERPVDGRGFHVNSAANLVTTREECAARLRLANLAHGRDPDKLGKPPVRKSRKVLTGELERCWSMPLSRNIGAD